MWDADYEVDYISPFSADESIMWRDPIDSQSQTRTDRTTLFELEVFKKIK